MRPLARHIRNKTTVSEAAEQQFIYVPRKILVGSLIAHACVPVLLLVNVGLEKLGISIFGKRAPSIEVYQNFIQVDVVGLPDELMNQRTDVDSTLPLVEKPATAEEPGKAAEDPEAMQLEEEKKLAEANAKKKVEEAKVAAAEEKKAKADKDKALKQMQREADKEAALKSLKDNSAQAKGRGKISGNLLSKGTAMTGRVGSAKDQYSAMVAQAIRKHFNIYQWQKKKGLSASVYIEINAMGRVRETRLMKASRDPVFDAAVLQAVQESQPLPVPEDMSLVSDGITLEFRPEN